MSKSKKERKLEHYLNIGKTICGSVDSEHNGKTITTAVALRRIHNKSYELELEAYYPGIDISEFNLRNEKKIFTTLEEALAYLEQEEIRFTDMHR